MATAEAAHKDKFDSVIPVYFYSDPKEFASQSSALDEVIKHSTTAIQIHTPSNWTDDHFLLIGQSNYLKGEYGKASNSFKYITTEFKEGVDYIKVMKSLGKRVGKYVLAKRKALKPQAREVINKDGTKSLERIDNRPEKSIWIHTPARTEAVLWLIKTYTRQKKYDEAATVITYARGDNLFYKNYDAELNLVDADLRVSKKDYAGAIEPLNKYVDAKTIKNKKRLTLRPFFVLAQCYQITGNNKKAIENYKRVLKSRPTTEMEFYAKIKMAKLSRGSSGDNKEMRALLAHMVKDNRYHDYWDQVYYEMALLSISDKNRDEARKFLHKSIKVSTNNDDQKALSFLKLADMDYEEEAYVTSKFLYDSTLRFLAKNDSRYGGIDEKDKMLSNLVKQLNIIAEEDSIQKLATLSKSEIEKVIKNSLSQKEKQIEEEKAAADAAKQQQQNLVNNPQTTANKNGQQPPSNWYFYNQGTVALGYNEFTKKWGRRNLEENWRRKDKTTTSVAIDETAADTVVEKKDTVQTPKGTPEEQMYAGIPTSPEKMAKSVDRIVDAYYMAGTIYKDGLESYGKAQDMFETVNERYPKHKLLLESYYNLYLIAMKRKMTNMAEKYKALILSEFPESVIAKVLKDPNYVNEAKTKEKAINEYYQSAYEDYSKNKLDSAWYKSEMSNSVFKPNPLSAKFQLLEALILAKQNRLSDYVQALNAIVNKTSDVQVKKAATDLLATLNKSSLPQIDLSKDTSRRDSLNDVYSKMQSSFSSANVKAAKPDSAEITLLQKLEAAKQLAIKQGKFVDTAQVKTNPAKDSSGNAVAENVEANDNATQIDTAANIVQVDTTSPYKRSDKDTHYFIVYIKDGATPQSSIMSTMAKIDAFNSTQYPTKKLQAKQTIIDSKNKLLNIRQFKDRNDAIDYFNAIKGQGQLFNDFKASQYAITVISTTNFSILLSQKDIDAYNKYFNRVYNGK